MKKNKDSHIYASLASHSPNLTKPTAEYTREEKIVN